MEIFLRLRDDHARVLAEAEALERAGAGPAGAERRAEDLRRFVAALERQFATHMRVEDEVLFPALLEALPEAQNSVAPLRLEHEELRSMLGALARVLGQPAGRAREEQIAVQTRDLVDLLRIHIRKEEAVVFRVAERVLPEPALRRIAGRLQDPSRTAPGSGPRVEEREEGET